VADCNIVGTHTGAVPVLFMEIGRNNRMPKNGSVVSFFVGS
jgi:hypothetical protein